MVGTRENPTLEFDTDIQGPQTPPRSTRATTDDTLFDGRKEDLLRLCVVMRHQRPKPSKAKLISAACFVRF